MPLSLLHASEDVEGGASNVHVHLPNQEAPKVYIEGCREVLLAYWDGERGFKHHKPSTLKDTNWV